MNQRLLKYRRYSIVISACEILSVFVITVLVGIIIESKEKNVIPLWYVLLSLCLVGFTIAYKGVNTKKGANRDSLDPFILNTDIHCFDDLIQKAEKRLRIRISFLGLAPACYGVKKGKYNIYYSFIRLSDCEEQHREELQRAKTAMKEVFPTRMTRSEWLKHTEFEILVVEHLSEDMRALANRNLAVEPRNKGYIVAHNYFAVVDISRGELLIPAYWGDDIVSELKYEYCVKQIVSAIGTGTGDGSVSQSDG